MFDFTVQIEPSICMVRLRKCGKPGATMFNTWCKSAVVGYRIYEVQALPLNFVRFLRLAQISPLAARSPARRQRDSRAISGKIAGKISCGISAQLPGNGRKVAAATPSNVRQDGSQYNLPWPDLDTRCPRRKLARRLATWSRNSRAAVRTMASATSRKQLVGFSPSAFTVTSKNYEHAKHTNARSGIVA
jgi:hypothetical protein